MHDADRPLVRGGPVKQILPAACTRKDEWPMAIADGHRREHRRPDHLLDRSIPLILLMLTSERQPL
jgi:hypothetical protein